MMYGKYLHLRVYGKDWREMRLLTRVFGGNYHDHMAAKMPVYHCWQITKVNDLKYALQVIQDWGVELPARLEALRSYVLGKSGGLSVATAQALDLPTQELDLTPDGIDEEVCDQGQSNALDGDDNGLQDNVQGGLDTGCDDQE